MAPLIGRVTERRVLRAALSAVLDGHGSLVLIGGPAGIGKTALVDQARAEAARRALPVARGYALDDPGAPPLWPWTRLLHDWPRPVDLPAAEPDDSEAAARFRVGRQVVASLRERAQDAGLLVVLEDLHWADRTSLLVLRHVVGELPDLRVCVLATYRDNAAGELAGVLPDLVRGSAAHLLALRGLTAEEIAEWLGLLAGPADPSSAAAMHRWTGGNPLLVRLVAEGSGGQGSHTLDLAQRPQLRRLVAARSATLRAADRAVVDAAAVLGARILAGLLATMCGLPASAVSSALDAAQHAGILADTADGLAFEHALVREAIYAELGADRRESLHRAAAEALGAAGAPPGVVATHWHRVDGEPAAAQCARWAADASRQARSLLAFDDAVRFADMAVDRAQAGRLAPLRVAELQLLAAEAHVLVNRFDVAVTQCLAAADTAEAAGAVDVLTRAGLVVRGCGNPAVVQAVAGICRRALDRLAPDEHAARARLSAQIAVGLTEIHGGFAGAELASEALAEADRSGDETAMVEALAARHLAITVPWTVQERLELGRRAVELGAASEQPIVATWGHLWRSGAALQLGNLTEFDRELREVDRVARERGSVLARWHHHRLMAMRLALTGDFAAARAADEAASDLAHRVEDISLIGMTYAFRNHLGLLRGDPGEMPPGWEDVLRRAPAIPLVQLCLPMQHALAGDLDRARAEFEQFRHLPGTYPVGVRWAATLGHVGLTAVLIGDAEVAGATFEALRRCADDYENDGSGAVFCGGATAGLLAELALVAGRPDDALRLFRDAVTLNARIGARPSTALNRLGWARALLALGRDHDPVGHDSVTSLIAVAAAEFERLDMPGRLATARRLAGVRIDARTGTDAGPKLTARETEVAELVAEALSNRDIAARLFLSERTVETHVRSILSKRGFTRRTEIATWLVGERAAQVARLGP